MALTDEQLERYSRHIILKEVGATGQKELLNAKVLIIGAGGLGAPAALYLAAAGVGTIGIVDADVVDLSNLQRQVIHTTNDIGKKKDKDIIFSLMLSGVFTDLITYFELTIMKTNEANNTTFRLENIGILVSVMIIQFIIYYVFLQGHI